MGSNNTRIIQKDVLADVPSTSGGDSGAIDLNGAVKFSCQAIYDVITTTAAAVPDSNIFDKDDPTHPSQFNKTAHGLPTGLKVRLTTPGTLPDPLQTATDYFVIAVDANYFQLAATLDDALAGIEIELNDIGVGTTTVTQVALAGASVTFQKSNDATNWTDIAAATSITNDGITWVENAEVSYRYFKVVKALTAGVVDLKAITLVIGDDI